MSEDYTFDDESELMQKSDEELFNNHVIGDDTDLQLMNNMVANYFTAYKLL